MLSPQNPRALPVTSTRSAATPKAAPAAKGANDAIALLKADHEALGHLFAEYGKTHSASNKKALVAEICTALSVHARIAEEIFYPAVKDALKDAPGSPEGTLGHDAVKDLLAHLEGVEPDGKLYDAKVRSLSEHVKHHIKQEQSEIFPRARATSVDMSELGARMAARRQDLLAHKS